MSSYNRNKVKKLICKFSKKIIDKYNKEQDLQKKIRKEIDRTIINIRDSGVSEENIDRWFGEFKNTNKIPKLSCIFCENDNTIKITVYDKNACISECLCNIMHEIIYNIRSEFEEYIDDINCWNAAETVIYIKIK